MVDLSDIREARRFLEGRIHRTPTTGSTCLGKRIGARVFLKLEIFQKTGSFKPRGVFNNMRHLTEAERDLGVISISAGNHAQALAYVATRMGVRSTIVMPARAVRSKVEATREYGGEVILTEGSLLETMQRVQEERHLTLVHLARATKRWRPGNSV
jgi:threonine dehydratase